MSAWPRRCRKIAEAILAWPMNCLVRTDAGLAAVNAVYERSPWWAQDICVRLNVKQPDRDAVWVILLENGRRVRVPVKKGDLKAWQFAHSYKWQSPALSSWERFIHGLYPRQSLFVDIGANMGMKSLYPLSIGRPCLLFEPNTALRSFTETVFRLNGFDGFAIENVCVSNREGAGSFYLSRSSYESSVNEKHAATSGPAAEVRADFVTLDAYFARHGGLARPAIIKIDVEGHEVEVLQGAAKTIESHLPTLFVEVHGRSAKAVLSILVSMGYRPFAVDRRDSTGLTPLDDHKIGQFSRMSGEEYADVLFVAERTVLGHVRRRLARAKGMPERANNDGNSD